MRWHGGEGKGCSGETPGFQDVMTCQPTQDLFFLFLIGSESGMPSDKLVATPTVGRQSHTHTCEHTVSRQGQNGETPTGSATTGKDPL